MRVIEGTFRVVGETPEPVKPKPPLYRRLVVGLLRQPLCWIWAFMLIWVGFTGV
jgi:hypothetical protein